MGRPMRMRVFASPLPLQPLRYEFEISSMNFSKRKIIVFFATLLVLGWFLYPRELFLGFIYEGTQQLEKAEGFYHRYLQKRTLNKFATLRLAMLYERMGEPEKATPLLRDLYAVRKKDWKVATRYLDYLENLHDEEGLYRLRREVAENFMKAPLFPKGRVIELLDGASITPSGLRRPMMSTPSLTRF